jgi:hypothetical protein
MCVPCGVSYVDVSRSTMDLHAMIELVLIVY